MIKVRDFDSFNPRQLGDPWIARIINGKINFDIEVGGYTGTFNKGEEGYLYLNNTPLEGELFASGQKHYGDPRKCFTNYLVYKYDEFVEITRKDMLKLSNKATPKDKMEKVDATDMLLALLDCGTFDLDFLYCELKAWKIDIRDAIKKTYDQYRKVDIDILINAIYSLAYNKLMLGRADDNISLEYYTNCIDSHFYLKIKGERHEFYSYDEAKEYLDNYFLNLDEE